MGCALGGCRAPDFGSRLSVFGCGEGRKGMGFVFEKLEVYGRAVALAERLVRMCCDFPQGYYAIADQLRRSVVSISCNIAEGNGRWSAKERKHFFMIARGSAYECVPLLRMARNLGLVESAEHEEVRNELDQICGMIGGLIRRAAGREKPDRQSPLD